MISDTLSQAVAECRRYLADPTFAPIYQGETRVLLEHLVTAMDQMRRKLDEPPASLDANAAAYQAHHQVEHLRDG